MALAVRPALATTRLAAALTVRVDLAFLFAGGLRFPADARCRLGARFALLCFVLLRFVFAMRASLLVN
ncbi:MAG TPA: hypothetical protein VGI65_00080 [Steroidobacteraceae bacterium]|jgi:hypothetical protein